MENGGLGLDAGLGARVEGGRGSVWEDDDVLETDGREGCTQRESAECR